MNAAIIAGAGIPYHIDLSNEGIPPSCYAAFLQYSQELWNDYVSMFGSSDTIGFSIIALYGNHGSPQLFDVHIYNDAGNSFLHQWAETQCLSSTRWSPHSEWYAE